MEKSFEARASFVDEERQAQINATIEENRERGLAKIEGEYEKTSEETTIIETYNTYLNELFESLGIKYDPIDPGRIHLFPSQVYNSVFGTDASRAKYYPRLNAAFFDNDESNKITKYHGVLHEMVHMASHIVYLPDNSVDEKASAMHTVVGADIDLGHDRSYFTGLNEGITDYITIQLLGAHKDELLELISASDENSEASVAVSESSYPFVSTVHNITQKLANDSGLDIAQIIALAEKCALNDDPTFIQMIGKFYDRGALKILSALGRRDKTETHEGGARNKLIMEYFATDDPGLRQELANKILQT